MGSKSAARLAAAGCSVSMAPIAPMAPVAMALLAAAAACAHALVPGSPSCGRAVLRRRGVLRFQGPGVGSSFPAHDGGGDAPGARGALKGVILGGGSFGLAMACVLGRAGVPATLLVRSRADADALNARGRHPKYLPDVDLPEAVWKSNLQPDFNARVCDSFDASSSAVLRELDESHRFVQRSAESTST